VLYAKRNATQFSYFLLFLPKFHGAVVFLLDSFISLLLLACVAGVSKTAREGNETATESKNKEQGEGVR